jgi:hypothetical protein
MMWQANLALTCKAFMPLALDGSVILGLTNDLPANTKRLAAFYACLAKRCNTATSISTDGTYDTEKLLSRIPAWSDAREFSRRLLPHFDLPYQCEHALQRSCMYAVDLAACCLLMPLMA